MSRSVANLHQLVAYATATLVAILVGWLSHEQMPGAHLLVHVLVADIVGTIVVFGFSRFHDNSSLYDPYWSVAPIVIAATYAWIDGSQNLAEWAAFGLVVLWGVRLTFNFLSGWGGLDHEDWRYRDFRKKFPRAYWWVSFGGIHAFPTLLVYLGCFPLWAIFFADAEPIPALAIAGGLTMLAATVIEAVADRQLREFVRSEPPRGAIMDQGLWRYSRHPNYFGELTFWWGLWLFGCGVSPDDWLWTFAGPASMTILFVFVSIPLLDRRSLERREGYADHMKRVSGLVPLPRRD